MLWFLMVAVATCAVTSTEGVRSESSLSSRINDMTTVQWTGGSFDWPCDAAKNMFKTLGFYDSKNIMTTRVAINKDFAFAAMPRYKSGVPVTLAKLPLKTKNCAQPTLKPYPCWELQEQGNCAALQSVVDIFLDLQEVLWVLDTGIVNFQNNATRTCPPKVMAINVKNGKVLRTINLESLTTKASRLQYVTADYSADGRSFIYVTDAANRAILVYDVTSGKGYRVVLPLATTMGCTSRNVLYPMLLHRADGTTCLAFSYLCGSRVFSIRTEYLQNGSPTGKIHDLGPKNKKMIFLGTDNGSALFFRYYGEADVYRWDATTCFTRGNFQMVDRGNECSPVTQVVPDYGRNRMRVFESNYPDFFANTVGCGVTHALRIMGSSRDY